MSDPDCDVCGGRGEVSLPVMTRDLSAAPITAEAFMIEIKASRRDFPCPQCVQTVQDHCLIVVAKGGTFMPKYCADEVRPGARRTAAHKLMDDMLASGAIQFDERDAPERYPGSGQHDLVITCRVGVVRPEVVAGLERRVADRLAPLIEEFTDQACGEIDNWGSRHADTTALILKRDARYLIRSAAVRFLQKMRQALVGKPAG